VTEDAAVQRLKTQLLQLPLKQIKQASKNGGLARTLETLISVFQLDRFDSPSHPREGEDQQDSRLRGNDSVQHPK
jgi:hypothetical protein